MRGFIIYLDNGSKTVIIGTVPDNCPRREYFSEFGELVNEWEKAGYEVIKARAVTPCSKCPNRYCENNPLNKEAKP